MADGSPRFAGNLEATSEAARAARLKGIGLMLAALACFACLDAIAKTLNHQMHAIQAVWARYAFHFLLAFVFLNPWTTPGITRTKKLPLQIGRATLLVLSTASNFVALKYLQLDEAMTITFATPFVVAILAGPMLGEWVGPKRLAAILVGFLGVLVVTRPGLGGIHPAAALSFLNCLFYALYIITTRMLAGHDATSTTLFYSSLIGAAIVTPLAPFVWIWPTWQGWILMVAVGGFGALGHYFFIAAHRLAPAAVLSPFIYTQLIAAAALGFVIFGHVPGLWTLAGAGIVIGSGLYLLMRERRGRVVKTADIAPAGPER
ncbi:drug/metabolite transporter (DMT)-like permease [Methylopila capsulata]|uniref:DMT transporter permease n=1 Tax=Methylopila capsulata TaxID=61654 RepID=A0A9W6IQK3_9HYPH|nr:DMT family transporter [Methylopila capsulata]MBM7851310.1 drug/metabolite transporter (DMT)-like permease [Methylopila capsulata]GLK54368.1 DMT transporter permease [Methylopila capsulata]